MPYRLWIDTSGNRLPAIFTVIMSLAANHGVNLRTAADGRDLPARSLAATGVEPMSKKREERERGEPFVYRAARAIADFASRGDPTSKPRASQHLLPGSEFRPAGSADRMDPGAVQTDPREWAFRRRVPARFPRSHLDSAAYRAADQVRTQLI
ncbi:MAG TPA: hypothetical protein VF069_17120 [Streptosporangiaceae bacterium]